MSARLRIGLQATAVAVVLALLAILIWKLATGSGETKQPTAFELPRLDRPGTLSLASLKGKVVVLNFWASWCGPCKDEAPALEKVWRRYRDRGVVVVGIDSQDFTSDAKAFIRKYGLTYPNVHDGKGKLSGPYGVSGYPETRFIGRDGKYVGEHVKLQITEQQLIDNIELALGS